MANEPDSSVAGVLYLDGTRLSRALRAGIARVLNDAEYLNKINVFPVPDGDTGTNLVLTLRSVLAALGEHRERSLGATIEVVADSALDGARGNSGAILAQFFHGLSDGATGASRWTTGMFAQAVRQGAQYAREAMGEPREGTIITVIDAFAVEITRQARDSGNRDFAKLLGHGLARARIALANTTNQLEALRKAGVVDAGAKGFVDLLEGVTDYVLKGSARDSLEQPVPDIEFPSTEFAASEAVDLTHRFCTECVIVGEKLDRRKIQESLAGTGSSMVIAGLRNRIRVHIHVNEPERVFEIAARHGEVQHTKVDDMRQQQHSAIQRASRVAVATDSAADLPEEVMENLGIHLIPVRLHFGERSYLDKVSLSPDEFYHELKRNPIHPQTSQPAPGDLRRMFEFLSGHYEHVVSLHVTGKASGTFQAARSAASRIHAPDKVTPLDSQNASVGQGLVAMYAAELAATGASPQRVLEGVRHIIPLTRTYALLGNLDYAVKGGRVAASKQRLAEFLRATPVLKLGEGGSIVVGGLLFGKKNRLLKFVRFIRRRQAFPGPYRVLIAHGQRPELANQLASLLRQELAGIQEVWVTQLGTALGVHGGPGTLVVALQEGYESGPGNGG
jgi:DegV family protein with EDD domain